MEYGGLSSSKPRHSLPPAHRPNPLIPHLYISIPPSPLPKERRSRPRITDERPQHPPHLNPHKRVQHDPESNHPPMPRIPRNQRRIKPLQQSLPCEARRPEHKSIEQNRSVII